MRLWRGMARFNKIVTNRVQGLWAPYLPPWVLLEHRGRRSGREYRTPVMASVRGGKLVIAVLYGPESDWVRNLTSAQEGTVVRLGRPHRIDQLELVSTADRATRPAGLGWPATIADHVLVARLG